MISTTRNTSYLGTSIRVDDCPNYLRVNGGEV